VNPVAALTRKGATHGQAATVVYGLPLLILATLGLLLLDRQSGEAVLVVIAVSAPRALLCLAARWGEPGEGQVVPELPEWRAVHFNR
jgi:hypothetical protein